MRKYGWIIIVALLVAGCNGTAPQRPSQRKGEAPKADSTAIALMEMNQQLAQAADEQLHHLALQQEDPYALYERGVWAYVVEKGDTDQPVLAGEECLLDSDLTARIGKYELPAAVDENITEWNHGAKVRMLAPWYAAYGIKGTDYIPPYENVIIELNIR